MTKRLWAVFLSVVLAISMVSATAWAADTRVTRCNLRLRAEPNTGSETLATVPGGTEITVHGTSGAWTKTTYNGHTGYVSSDHLMDLTRSGYYPLKQGDENQYVKSLQERLITLGYLSGKADGVYGKSTTEAVVAFQKANGIGQDGIAGGETQRIMFGDTAKGLLPQATATATNADTGKEVGALDTYEAGGVLKKGSRGDEVKSLQNRLIELGYLSGKADGVYGADTEKAVETFQRLSNLSVDGKAGKVTQNLLYSNGATKADGTTIAFAPEVAAEDYQTLKRGMTNDDIKSLQKRLKELGYLSASATGYYGSQTLAAVEAFQKANGLTADGIAGSATQKLLYSSTAQKAGSQLPTESTQTYATLKEGMKSTAVTTMQKKLKELGYMNANATGFYGSATKAAVTAFQKGNGLTADGIAGSATLAMLYGSGAIAAGSSGTGAATGVGKISGPSGSSVRLLHWFNEIKPSMKSGSTLLVFDPSTGYGWNLRAMSLGRHCDSEPLTAEDTSIMNMAFGGKTTWNPKVVYIKLPSGTWTMATMHNTPHLSGSIKNNNFDGHLCVHFLRDMDEAAKNDPKYGVQNQKVLREGWKKLTGQDIK